MTDNAKFIEHIQLAILESFEVGLNREQVVSFLRFTWNEMAAMRGEFIAAQSFEAAKSSAEETRDE